jgi:hypothetical protein
MRKKINRKEVVNERRSAIRKIIKVFEKSEESLFFDELQKKTGLNEMRLFQSLAIMQMFKAVRLAWSDRKIKINPKKIQSVKNYGSEAKEYDLSIAYFDRDEDCVYEALISLPGSTFEELHVLTGLGYKRLHDGLVRLGCNLSYLAKDDGMYFECIYSRVLGKRWF